MPETRRRFDRDFQQGAVRLVLETGKPIAQVARELGVHEGTLGNWVGKVRRAQENGTAPSSEDAGVEAGVSPAVGTRWFREAGG